MTFLSVTQLYRDDSLDALSSSSHLRGVTVSFSLNTASLLVRKCTGSKNAKESQSQIRLIRPTRRSRFIQISKRGFLRSGLCREPERRDISTSNDDDNNDACRESIGCIQNSKQEIVPSTPHLSQSCNRLYRHFSSIITT